MQEYPPQLKPWYKKRWVRVLGVLLLFMLGLSWLGSSVLSKPDATVLAAAEHALKTPGTYIVESTMAKGSLAVADNAISWTGTIEGIDADMMLTGTTLYLKTPAPERIYALVAGGSANAQIASAIQSLQDQLRDKWIRVDLQNGQLGVQLTHTLQCVYEQKVALQQNESARGEWLHAFENTPMWVIRKSSGNDTTAVYQLLLDTTARATLSTQVKQTAYYQALAPCTGSIDLSQIAEGQWLNATVTLSEPAHVAQSIVVDLGKTGTMTITPNYQAPASVVLPTDAVSLDQLIINYIKSLLGIKK